jgi:methionyl-tRNA formyltransferase
LIVKSVWILALKLKTFKLSAKSNVMKILFMGTPAAAVASLRKIIDDGHEVVAVWTQPDKPSGRGNKLNVSPVKEFALENNLAIFQPTKVKTEETLELFRSSNAEIAVVVAYGRILPEPILNALPKGCLNVHFSLLPKYRGAAPVNWVIVNGDKITGVTTMQMDAGLDTGDILMQRETQISHGENAIELMSKLSVLGADLLSETLMNLESLKPIPQQHEIATLAPIMKKEDGLIDWNLSANDIFNRVRGFQPFPGSFTFWNGKKLTIWKSSVSELENVETRSGDVIDAKGDSLVISCGNRTVLRIDELQLEGKNRMKTRDFLNGIKILHGERLG